LGSAGGPVVKAAMVVVVGEGLNRWVQSIQEPALNEGKKGPIEQKGKEKGVVKGA